MVKNEDTQYGINVRLTGTQDFIRYTTVPHLSTANSIFSALIMSEIKLWDAVELEIIKMVDNEPVYETYIKMSVNERNVKEA